MATVFTEEGFEALGFAGHSYSSRADGRVGGAIAQGLVWPKSWGTERGTSLCNLRWLKPPHPSPLPKGEGIRLSIA